MSTRINFDVLNYEWFTKDGERAMFSNAGAVAAAWETGWRPVYALVQV